MCTIIRAISIFNHFLILHKGLMNTLKIITLLSLMTISLTQVMAVEEQDYLQKKPTEKQKLHAAQSQQMLKENYKQELDNLRLYLIKIQDRVKENKEFSDECNKSKKQAAANFIEKSEKDYWYDEMKRHAGLEAISNDHTAHCEREIYDVEQQIKRLEKELSDFINNRHISN